MISPAAYWGGVVGQPGMAAYAAGLSGLKLVHNSADRKEMSQPAGCGCPAHRRVHRGSLCAAADAKPGALSACVVYNFLKVVAGHELSL